MSMRAAMKKGGQRQRHQMTLSTWTTCMSSDPQTYSRVRTWINIGILINKYPQKEMAAAVHGVLEGWHGQTRANLVAG